VLTFGRDGTIVSTTVAQNSKARARVIVWRTGTEETLRVDVANVVALKERERFVAGLPEDVREEAARQLEEIALEIASSAESKREDSGAGSAMLFPEVKRWTGDVDGAAILDDIVALLERYVVLPDGATAAIALWALHTHALDAAAISPLLAVLSPEKRCGKTRVLGIVAGLVRRPLPTANITAAGLFRTIEKFQPTLLIDEADAFMRDNEELRGVVNSGHSRSMAFTVRLVGDAHEPRTFSTWAPKAIAGLGTLPGTVIDRAIVIRMRRRTKEESVERFRTDRPPPELEPLMRRATRWAADNLAELRDADPEVPDALGDRAADNWRPLFAIANLAGGEWPKRARSASLVLSGFATEDESSVNVVALSDLRALFVERAADKLSTTTILAAFHDRADRPWAEWGRQKRPISASGLAGLFKRYGIRPKNAREGSDVFKGYDRESCKDAFKRYLSPDPATDPLQPLHDDAASTSGDARAATVAECSGTDEGSKSSRDSDVAAVAAQRGGSRRESANWALPLSQEEHSEEEGESLYAATSVEIDGVVYPPDGSQELTPERIREFQEHQARRREERAGMQLEDLDR
jgi:hypothetical protein